MYVRAYTYVCVRTLINCNNIVSKVVMINNCWNRSLKKVMKYVFVAMPMKNTIVHKVIMQVKIHTYTTYTYILHDFSF